MAAGTAGRINATRRIVVLGLAILVCALILDFTALGIDADDVAQLNLSVLAIAVAFAVAEFVVLHIERGKNAFSVSLSELPLIVGLFTVPVSGLVAARVVGGALALAFVRKQPATKLFFNV